MKRHFFSAMLTLSLLFCCGIAASGREEGRGAQTETVQETEYECHIYEDGGASLMVEMPGSWLYSPWPNYHGGAFIKEVYHVEDYGPIGSGNFTFGVGGLISFGYRSNPLLDGEDFVFADGGKGYRMYNDKFGVHREQIYRIGSNLVIYVTVVSEAYEEHLEEVQHFLKSASYQDVQEGIPAQYEADGSVRQYHLHIHRWSLQADLTIPGGFYADWNALESELWFEGWWGDYDMEQEYLTLSLEPEKENILLMGVPVELPENMENISKPYVCTLSSGVKGLRQDFVQDGKKGSYVHVYRPGCGILIYGDRFEELEEIMQSVWIW